MTARIAKRPTHPIVYAGVSTIYVVAVALINPLQSDVRVFCAEFHAPFNGGLSAHAESRALHVASVNVRLPVLKTSHVERLRVADGGAGVGKRMTRGASGAVGGTRLVLERVGRTALAGRSGVRVMVVPSRVAG